MHPIFMIKRLAKCIREYKWETIASPILVGIEVILEILVTFQIAHLIDFVESSPTIRVISEDGSIANWPNDHVDVDQENWPYAVIANAEDEPIRKIKVNPVQYCQSLDDEDMIDVLVADKLTQMPKKIIKIIS